MCNNARGGGPTKMVWLVVEGEEDFSRANLNLKIVRCIKCLDYLSVMHITEAWSLWNLDTISRLLRQIEPKTRFILDTFIL